MYFSKLLTMFRGGLMWGVDDQHPLPYINTCIYMTLPPFTSLSNIFICYLTRIFFLFGVFGHEVNFEFTGWV